MIRTIAIIGAPTSAGAFAPGQEDAPAALRLRGLPTPCAGWDVAFATAATSHNDPRLVYLDLHADLNTPQSVPDGALDWTGVAHMLDIPDTDERLAAAGSRRPLLADDDIVLLGRGPDQGTPFENELVATRNLTTIEVDDLASDPHAAARRARDRAAEDGRPFLVHFDVDLIDFLDVPLSENTGRGTGVPFASAFAALEVLTAADGPLALTVTELNPHHGAADRSDTARLAQALANALR